MTPELQNRLSALADRLGVSIDHLWAVLVRQAYIEGVWSLLHAALALLVMAGATVGYWFAFWRGQSGDDPLSKSLNRTTGGFVATMIMLAFALLFCESAYNAMTNFLNPEYFAIRHLPFTR